LEKLPGRDGAGGLPWIAVITYASETLWTVWKRSGMKGYRAALAEFTVPLALIAAAAVALIVLARWLKRRRAGGAGQPGRGAKS